MIETLEGLKNADAIAKVPGVSAVFAASGDLGNFTGFRQGTPDYERARSTSCTTPRSKRASGCAVRSRGATAPISPASRPEAKRPQSVAASPPSSVPSLIHKGSRKSGRSPLLRNPDVAA